MSSMGSEPNVANFILEYGQPETNNSYLEIKPTMKYEAKVIISYTNTATSMRQLQMGIT